MHDEHEESKQAHEATLNKLKKSQLEGANECFCKKLGARKN